MATDNLKEAHKQCFYFCLNEKYVWRGKECLDERMEGGGNGIGDDDDDNNNNNNEDKVDGKLKLGKKSSRSLIDDNTMKKYIDIVENFKSNTKRKAEAYYLYNKYEVKDGYLYNKVKGTRMIPLGEVFDEIYESHISTGHGGEKRTFHDLQFRGISNISLKHVGLFISTCKICLKKKIAVPSTLSKSNVVKPIISGNFGERGQVDLIDMSSFKTTQHRYILNYQDHFSKFCILRPLLSKDVASVIKELVSIFSIIGCPKILQCDNGLEFRFDEDLKKIWPPLQIIHGRPRHPQSQGSVERANQDIEQIMRCWLADNNTTDWVRGLPFIQMQKNNALNRTLGFSPYFAVFGKTMSLNVNKNNNNDDDDEYSILNDSHSDEDDIGIIGAEEKEENENDRALVILNIDDNGTIIKSNEKKEEMNNRGKASRGINLDMGKEALLNHRGKDSRETTTTIVSQGINLDIDDEALNNCGKDSRETTTTIVSQNINLDIDEGINLDMGKEALNNCCGKDPRETTTTIVSQNINLDVDDEALNSCGKDPRETTTIVVSQGINLDIDDEALNSCGKDPRETTIVVSQGINLDIDDEALNNCGKDSREIVIQGNNLDIDKALNKQREEKIIQNEAPIPSKQNDDNNNINVGSSSSSSGSSSSDIVINTNKIEKVRKKVSENIEKEAKKVIDNNKECFATDVILEPDTIVSVKIPKWDKQHKLNLNCLLCRIIEYFPDKKKYKLASLESGIIINSLFSPRQLHECKNYKPTMVLEAKQPELPLRSIVIKEQDIFTHCKCISSCSSLKCRCKRDKRKCIDGLCHVNKKNNVKCINK